MAGNLNSSIQQQQTLKQLTAQDGLPDLQVYALTKEVDSRTAAWVGLENALVKRWGQS